MEKAKGLYQLCEMVQLQVWWINWKCRHRYILKTASPVYTQVKISHRITITHKTITTRTSSKFYNRKVNPVLDPKVDHTDVKIAMQHFWINNKSKFISDHQGTKKSIPIELSKKVLTNGTDLKTSWNLPRKKKLEIDWKNLMHLILPTILIQTP